MEHLKDRIHGCLLGLAAGDQNGGPIQMALCIAENLCHLNKFDRIDIFKRYLHWYHNGLDGSDDTGLVCKYIFNDLSPGTFSSIENQDLFIDERVKKVDEILKNQTAGVNPAHRCPPLALAGFISDEQLPSFTVKECLLSHQHIIIRQVASCVSVLIRQLILGQSSLEDACAFILKNKDLVTEVKVRQAILIGTIKNEDELKNVKINAGGFSPDTLATAIFFIRKHTLNLEITKLNNDQKRKFFTNCLKDSFKFAGPANYSPVLVGSILGSLLGASSIPKEMLKHCICEDRIIKVCNDLTKTWNK